jgi:hypothetical protein
MLNQSTLAVDTSGVPVNPVAFGAMFLFSATVNVGNTTFLVDTPPIFDRPANVGNQVQPFAYKQFPANSVKESIQIVAGGAGLLNVVW